MRALISPHRPLGHVLPHLAGNEDVLSAIQSLSQKMDDQAMGSRARSGTATTGCVSIPAMATST